MSVLDFVLDGLEQALELERELGVRLVEIDRSLLTPGSLESERVLSVERVDGAKQDEDSVVPKGFRSSNDSMRIRDAKDSKDGRTSNDSKSIRDAKDSKDPNVPLDQRLKDASPDQPALPLVFLHDRPLSPQGVEMMAKIVLAMRQTAETAPIVVEPPVPRSKVLVVLGGRAMKKYFPEMKGEPGQWVKLPTGQEVLITYSPEYILRFGSVTPAVQKLKQDMWRSLKAVIQRLA